MHIIEPCCAKKQLLELRNKIGNKGTVDFEGYGDLSLTELLPALLTRYSEVEMMIVAPSLPDQAAEAIEKWMEKQWARMDGQGKIDIIKNLTIISSLGKKKSPMASAWKKENPFGERLTLINKQQNDTAILLPDFAITGPVNMRYGEHFVATATANQERIADLWNKYVNLEESEEEQTDVKEPASEEQESVNNESFVFDESVQERDSESDDLDNQTMS